jgi:hypothetical protein
MHDTFTVVLQLMMINVGFHLTIMTGMRRRDNP